MKRWIAALPALILLVGGVVIGYVVYKREEAADVRGSSTEEFVATEEEEPPYALDAATGDVKWRFRAQGDISGSGTVLNGAVYFSTFDVITYALGARSGEVLWTFREGKYAGVVADTERLYLVGHARVYGMVER